MKATFSRRCMRTQYAMTRRSAAVSTCPHSMRSRVYVSVRCPSVCLSHSSKPTAACLLLWARRAGDIDRLLHGRCSAAAAGEYGQCHVVSVRRKRNTDSLIYVTLLACCAFIKITLLLHNLFFYVVYLRHSTVTYKKCKTVSPILAHTLF